METEDIIELGSSDEDAGPPPPKKKHQENEIIQKKIQSVSDRDQMAPTDPTQMNAKNAMVHIPANLPGVTIKPIKTNVPHIPTLGKNITIKKTTGGPEDPLISEANQKHGAIKKKPVAKKTALPTQSKGKVFNPLSLTKPLPLPSTAITKLKNPIQIIKFPQNRPQSVQRLPPSITIKKAGSAAEPNPKMIMLQKPVLPKNIVQTNKGIYSKSVLKQQSNVGKKRKLDDDASTSSKSPQWYVRPEEHIEITIEAVPLPQEQVATSQEDVNNKEPEDRKFIEITIEDSPIKPAKTKRTRELSTEKVITIDDSPNKDSVAGDDAAKSSEDEANTTKKVRRGKKELKYPNKLPTVEEPVEIEIEPLDLDDPLNINLLNSKEKDKSNSNQKDESNSKEKYKSTDKVNKESKTVSLTPEILEAKQASVEIAQSKLGTVSVRKIKPVQLKQDTKVTTNEDVGMPSEFHPIYQNFISLCIQLENSNDMEKIIEKKIKPYYKQAPKEYIESEEFLNMVSSKITAMAAAPDKMFLYIKDIVDELNLQRKYIKHVPVAESEWEDVNEHRYGEEIEMNPNKKRQVQKLEETIEKLHRAIQILEAQEVDFKDESDSVYLLTEKYKERLVRVHAKFLQLTNMKLPSQPRIVIDPRPGLSAAPAKRLEALINRKNELTFPDFHDVLKCVREANNTENLGWNEAFIMEEARDLFVRCGRKLQRRRQENDWRLATSRITNNSDDPAEESDGLRKQLDANRRLANTKETELFDKFCDRQRQLKLEAEEIDDKEAEESPVESEEEDNDDYSSLKSKQRRKRRLRRLLHEQYKRNSRNKVQTEDNTNEEEESIIESVDKKEESEKKSEVVNEEHNIQSLSDDSNEIGSDMDELHLLQKLHSDCEIRTVSSSSDSETPIAISDTLDSSSDDEEPNEQQPTNVISIENSSYSDESDAEKSNAPKVNEKYTASGDLMEKNKEMECSSSGVAQNTHLTDAAIEGAILASSNDGSNQDDNINSRKCKTNDIAKPSDAEDEKSTNSDIIENPGSSASSGQYDELLKEHNADPLQKRPELIPHDPSDKLFDTMVIKHYNDPLVKKHLKGSDSSNADYPENSNSDTQSTIATETTEVKKYLVETSVDTEEFLNLNSPSVQTVDKLVDKTKQSDRSQSTDELIMKIDQEIGLNPDAISPVTLELEKAVGLARQTQAWPIFKDESSSMRSAGDDKTGGNKTNASKTDEVGGIEIEQIEESSATHTKDSEVSSNEFTRREQEAKDSAHCDIHSSKDDSEGASCSRSVNNLLNKMDIAPNDASIADLKDTNIDGSECTKNMLEEIDVFNMEIDSTEATNNLLNKMDIAPNDASIADLKDTNIDGSECTKNTLEEMDVFNIEIDSTEATKSNKAPEGTDIAHNETASHEVSLDTVAFNSEVTKKIHEDCNIAEIEMMSTEKNIDSFKNESTHHKPEAMKIGPELTEEKAKETEYEEISGESGDAVMKILNSNNKPEDSNGNESEYINNGNSNINIDITDLLDSDNLCPKIAGDVDLDHVKELETTENGECEKSGPQNNF